MSGTKEENPQEPTSALIISNRGKLRKSLQLLLKTVPKIESIYEADDLATALDLFTQGKLSIVLLNYPPRDDQSNGRLCLHCATEEEKATYQELLAMFRALKKKDSDSRYLALVNSEVEYQEVHNAGTDVTLLKGATAATILAAVESLVESPYF
ncbi:hypothetical protein KFU94_42810 [Chloroflexi bacterium TSY]|nr:hypothetical protein [Chloroflexi bacterium TSY]